MNHNLEIDDQGLRDELLEAVQKAEKARLRLNYQFNSDWSGTQMRRDALKVFLNIEGGQSSLTLRQSDQKPTRKSDQDPTPRYQETFPLSVLTEEQRQKIEEWIPVTEILPHQLPRSDWVEQTFSA